MVCILCHTPYADEELNAHHLETEYVRDSDEELPLVSPSHSTSELGESMSMEEQARPVSRAISHVGCSPTLTQRLRTAQSARRATSGYRNATRNGPNALQGVHVSDSLPVLEAAVQEAAMAAGVHVSPRHADKTVGGQAAVGGKAAVQWQEWLRKVSTARTKTNQHSHTDRSCLSSSVYYYL
jgi:hypothetical protein